MDAIRKFSKLVKIPDPVHAWERCMSPAELHRVSTVLGRLMDFRDIVADRFLIEALVHVWDREASVFRFGTCELTPTLEEISGFLGIPLQGRGILTPSMGDRKAFCSITGLYDSSVPGGPDSSSVTTMFLFGHFATLEGFHNNREHFYLDSEEAWRSKRTLVYGLVLAGTYLFPRLDGRISFKIVRMVADLFHRTHSREPTIVPAILADIFIACSRCQDGDKFFHGSNFILQAWALEHLSRRKLMHLGSIRQDMCWVKTHKQRVEQVQRRNSAGAYVQWFQSMQEKDVQWVLDWTDCHTPALQTNRYPFVPLVGTEGIALYVPKRVLRQFGRIQEVPPELGNSGLDMHFDKGKIPTPIPKFSQLLEAWNAKGPGLDSSFVSEDKCTPKTTEQYRDWLEQAQSGASSSQLLDPQEELRICKNRLAESERERAMEKAERERYQQAYVTLKREHADTKENERERKHRCFQLSEDIGRARNLYFRESAASKAERLDDELLKLQHDLYDLAA